MLSKSKAIINMEPFLPISQSVWANNSSLPTRKVMSSSLTKGAAGAGGICVEFFNGSGVLVFCRAISIHGVSTAQIDLTPLALAETPLVDLDPCYLNLGEESGGSVANRLVRMNRIIAFQPSLVSLVEKYQALLVDAYGVLVDKVAALPGVSDLIAYLNTSVKRYEQPGKIYS